MEKIDIDIAIEIVGAWTIDIDIVIENFEKRQLILPLTKKFHYCSCLVTTVTYQIIEGGVKPNSSHKCDTLSYFGITANFVPHQ